MLPLSIEKLEAIKDRAKDLSYAEIKNELTKDLTRNERRNIDRELDKMKAAFKTLTPIQHKLINAMANEKADEKMDRFNYIMDRAISAYFIIKNPDYDLEQITLIENEIAELITEDINKENVIFKANKGEYEMVKKAVSKMELELKDRVFELLNEGVGQKQIIEALTIEFPKLSKSMIANGVKKSKELWKEEHATIELSEEEKEINDAVEYILEEPVKKTAKTLKEAQEDVAAKEIVVTAEPKEEIKEVKNEVEEVKVSGLRVKEMNLVIEGSNGEYIASKDGVILIRQNAQIDFKNIEELEKWTSEVKEVFSMVKDGVA